MDKCKCDWGPGVWWGSSLVPGFDGLLAGRKSWGKRLTHPPGGSRRTGISPFMIGSQHVSLQLRRFKRCILAKVTLIWASLPVSWQCLMEFEKGCHPSSRGRTGIPPYDQINPSAPLHCHLCQRWQNHQQWKLSICLDLVGLDAPIFCLSSVFFKGRFVKKTSFKKSSWWVGW